MYKTLFLLEWRPCQTRVWAGWMALWTIISFLMLSAMLMTGHLLDRVILPPVWLLIWFSPILFFILKIRVTEMDSVMVHTVLLGGITVYKWKRAVQPGIWSVDTVNGRFRLNRITHAGKTVHFPWRLSYHPLFISSVEVIPMSGCARSDKQDKLCCPD